MTNSIYCTSAIMLIVAINLLYSECRYAECLDLFIVMLNVVMQCVFILSVIMLNVVTPAVGQCTIL